MSDTKLMRGMAFNLYRAMLFGYKPKPVQRLIYLRSDQVHYEIQHTSRYGHSSFSSTLMDDVGGCRIHTDIKYSHKEYWDVVWIPVTAEQEAKMWSKECQMSDVDELQAYKRVNGENSTYGDKKILYGPKRVKYDFWRGAVFSYISKATIVKPSKDNMVCNRACVTSILEVHPTAMDIPIWDNGGSCEQADYASMTPSQTDAMLRNFFGDKL